MKKIILIAALPVAILCGCSGEEENTPEAVTIGFCKAMAEKNYDRAKMYCTEASAKTVDANRLTGMFSAQKNITKEEADCKKDGDKANCRFCCIDEKPTSYNLVKENGKWKVDFSVLDINTDDALDALKEIKEGVESLGQ